MDHGDYANIYEGVCDRAFHSNTKRTAAKEGMEKKRSRGNWCVCDQAVRWICVLLTF